MNKYDILTQLYAPQTEALLTRIYGKENLIYQQKRYRNAIRYFDEQPCWDFCTDLEKIHIFRSPGRTEICGNHTDHQRGEVIAAAIDQDIVAVAAPSDNAVISITSGGFGEVSLPLSADVFDVRREELGTARALLRGVVSALLQQGYHVKGFCAYFTGDLPEGSGTSSFAAFENMIGCIISCLFNGGSIQAKDIARAGQTAENQYFGRTGSLMDQLTGACGGVLHMDLRDPKDPLVWDVAFAPSDHDYTICLVDTHSSDAYLSDEYTRIQSEMCHVAGMYRQDSLRGISMDELLMHCNEIREDCGDRAFLRAMHFVSENDRVKKQLASLKQNDFDAFLELVRMSGDSSFKCLQNVYSTRDPAKQPLAVALAVSETVLGDDGVCRVHGGGFAGTIQAFVKTPAVDRYCKAIDRLFGEGSCKPIRISPVGCVRIL